MIEKIKEKLLGRKKVRKESFLEFLCVVVSCWLVSVGTALIVDAQFTFQIGFKEILWQTLLGVVATMLVTRRWWIPIIYFGILVPVFFLAISLSGDITSFFQSFAGFVSWWASSMPYGSVWYSDKGFYLVHTFINIGIGILYFAVARIFKKAWVTAAVAAVFIILNYANGHIGYNIVSILFIVVGVFPLIAGERFQNIKLPDSKNLFGIWGKKWLFVVVSAFVAVMISVASFAIVTGTDGSVRNRFCSDVVADLQTAADVYTNEQKKVNISLFDLGLVTNSTYIGGNLYNIEPEIIAATDLTEPALIKMTSFDTFDGKMWTNGFEKSYRINSFWDEEQNAYLAGSEVDNSVFLEKIENVAYKTKVTFTLSSNSYFLPTVGQIVGFSEKTDTVNPVLYDKRGRLLSYYGFENGYTYTLDTLIYDTDQKILNTQIKGVLKTLNYKEDPLYDKESEFYKSFTQLPDEIPDELTKALEKIGMNSKNEYQKAYDICQYFSAKNGFVYTEEPATFKRGDSVIEKLFETKNGHCLYYSTAMVVMARKAGIPSRLVAGYRTVKNPNGKKQVVDVSSPYAWVECYIPNIGWMTFDPAPEEAVKPSNSGKNQIALGQQAVIPDVEVDAEFEKEEKKVAGTNLKWDTVVNIPLIICLVLVFLFVVCLILNTVLSQKFYDLARVRKRFASTAAQTEFYYQDILRQFSWLGFKFKKGETISELSQRVCDGAPESFCDILQKGIAPVEALHYGEQTPSDKDVESIFKARNMLERVLADKNNRFVYTVKRRLLLPISSGAVKKYNKKI